MIPIVLAHGATGIWDEVVFGGMLIGFSVFMVYAYVQSQNFDPELDGDDRQ